MTEEFAAARLLYRHACAQYVGSVRHGVTDAKWLILADAIHCIWPLVEREQHAPHGDKPDSLLGDYSTRGGHVSKGLSWD